MDVATLRIRGMSPVALKAEIENRYKSKTYTVPERTGVSYMVAPVMRTWMLPDWEVHTMPMPHLMFYAADVTDKQIGTAADSGLAHPFVFKEGLAEQSYIIQVMGEAETAKILAEEAKLRDHRRWRAGTDVYVRQSGGPPREVRRVLRAREACGRTVPRSGHPQGCSTVLRRPSRKGQDGDGVHER
jgi:hypothetical protein